MFLEKNCKFCFEVFVPSSANHQYCCKECKTAAYKEKEKSMSNGFKQKLKTAPGSNTHPTIDDIIDISKKVKEKTGKIVGYGFVSYLSDNGKLDILGV